MGLQGGDMRVWDEDTGVCDRDRSLCDGDTGTWDGDMGLQDGDMGLWDGGTRVQDGDTGVQDGDVGVWNGDMRVWDRDTESRMGTRGSHPSSGSPTHPTLSRPHSRCYRHPPARGRVRVLCPHGFLRPGGEVTTWGHHQRPRYRPVSPRHQPGPCLRWPWGPVMAQHPT